MAEITVWVKIPSVSHGGKSYFYTAMQGHQTIGSVVWDRRVGAYAVRKGDTLIVYTSTVKRGMREFDRGFK